MLLKLEKISLFLIIRLFSVWHDDVDDAMTMQLQASMPAATGDHLRPFQHNRFILWTYWHRPVARFRRRQRGRQSENGRGRGNFGLALAVILLRWWEPLGVVAEFGDATTGRTPSHVLSLRSTGVEGSRAMRGIGKVSRLIVKLGSRGWPQKKDVHWLRPNNSTKKYGEGTMLRCNQTNSRALNTMVPLKCSENRETLCRGHFGVLEMGSLCEPWPTRRYWGMFQSLPIYLLIIFFDHTVKKNTSTLRPNFDAFSLTN